MRRGSQHRELTPKQALAVELYVNPKSETFGNKTQSYIAAGYSCRGKTAMQAACRLFGHSNMCKAITQYQSKNIEIAEKQAVNEDITKAYTLTKLQETYNAAVTNKDTTNRVACIRLMMQYHGLLSDKLVIDLRDSRQLEEGHREAARRIAAHLLSDGILDAEFEPLLLPSQKGVVNSSQDDGPIVGEVRGGTVIPVDEHSSDNIIDSPE